MDYKVVVTRDAEEDLERFIKYGHYWLLFHFLNV